MLKESKMGRKYIYSGMYIGMLLGIIIENQMKSEYIVTILGTIVGYIIGKIIDYRCYINQKDSNIENSKARKSDF